MREFFGDTGSGMLFICSTTKRFLVVLRSKIVNEPGKWAVVGGRVDPGDKNVLEAAKREVKEELSYEEEYDTHLVHTYLSKSGKFTYYNYVGIVKDEFTPVLDDETDDFKWVCWDELNKMEDLHFGIIELLEKKSKELINILG